MGREVAACNLDPATNHETINVAWYSPNAWTPTGGGHGTYSELIEKQAGTESAQGSTTMVSVYVDLSQLQAARHSLDWTDTALRASALGHASKIYGQPLEGDTTVSYTSMGDMPLMTDNGTFIINGTERVIVSQMHRSPGVFFDHDKGKTHSSGKYLFAARVIPYRGSWLDFEFDSKDLVYVRIDRKRKLPVTTLLYALDSKATEALRAARAMRGEQVEISEIRGMDAEEILSFFFGQVVFTRTPKGWARPFDPEAFRGAKLLEPLVDAESGEVVADADTKMTSRAARKIAEKTKTVLAGQTDLVGRFVAEDLVNTDTGEIWAEAGEEFDRGEARLARGGGAGHSADARGRPGERAVDPQHAGGRQVHRARGRAGGHVPSHAPR